MANQTHDVGEPLKMDDAKLRRLIAIGEPLSRNWRVDSYLYEGMATEWFHVWETGDGYGVYSTECLIEEYDTREEALCVMRQLHDLQEREQWEKHTRLRDAWTEARDTALCYFIGSESGPVKIGVSKDVQRRLRALQSGHPYTLSILATVEGGYAAERRYHERFAAHRLRGEWFDCTDDIRTEINRLAPRHCDDCDYTTTDMDCVVCPICRGSVG